MTVELLWNRRKSQQNTVGTERADQPEEWQGWCTY